MGVTIGTRRCGISMGYGSFFRFRVAVASSINSVVGWVYESYVKESIKSLYRNDTCVKGLAKKMSETFTKFSVDEDIVDFLFQPDCDGRISYTTARKIRDLCKISKSDETFGYDRDRRSMSEMAEIFNDGYKHRCQVKWC